MDWWLHFLLHVENKEGSTKMAIKSWAPDQRSSEFTDYSIPTLISWYRPSIKCQMNQVPYAEWSAPLLFLRDAILILLPRIPALTLIELFQLRILSVVWLVNELLLGKRGIHREYGELRHAATRNALAGLAMEPMERRWRENGEGWRNMEMVVRNLCRIILYICPWDSWSN